MVHIACIGEMRNDTEFLFKNFQEAISNFGVYGSVTVT
jgi:hypothetical protein